MRKVVLESPFAGNVETNIKYARRAMKHALDLGEAPYASHLLFTQEGILDDNIQEERNKGIEAGLIWGSCAEATNGCIRGLWDLEGDATRNRTCTSRRSFRVHENYR